jgi:hypothetical protein
MNYLEWLRAGSEFHEVSRATEHGFTITAVAGDTNRVRFNDVVETAIANANGYEIKPHRSDQDSYGYDFAAITIRQ